LKKSAIYFASGLAVLAASPAMAQSTIDWSGFYIGASGSVIGAETNAGAPRASFTGSDVSPGLFAGYNYTVSPSFVIGGELDYGFGESGFTSLPFLLKNERSLRLRLGYTTGKSMFYGAIGYAEDTLHLGGSGTDTTGTGYVIAVGIEHMLTPKVSLRGEYAHAEYDGYGTLPPVWKDKTDTLTFGVAYRF